MIEFLISLFITFGFSAEEATWFSRNYSNQECNGLGSTAAATTSVLIIDDDVYTVYIDESGVYHYIKK